MIDRDEFDERKRDDRKHYYHAQLIERVITVIITLRDEIQYKLALRPPRRLRNAARILDLSRALWLRDRKIVESIAAIDESSYGPLVAMIRRAAVLRAAERISRLPLFIEAATAAIFGLLVLAAPAFFAVHAGIHKPARYNSLLYYGVSYIAALILAWCLYALIARVPVLKWTPLRFLLGAGAAWYAWHHQVWSHYLAGWQLAPTVGAMAAFATSSVLDAPSAILTWLGESLIHSRLGTLAPAQAASMNMIYLLSGLNSLRSGWRRPANRRRIASMLSKVSSAASSAVRQAARVDGARNADLRWAADRANDVAVSLRAHRRSLLNACSYADYDAILQNLANQAIGLSFGDWSVIAVAKRPMLRTRLISVLRRLLPSVVLGTAGIVLPYVPGADGPSTALTTMRVVLWGAALTSLLSLDGSTRDLILSAYKDVAHRSR